MYIRHITYVTYVTYVINVNFGIHTGHEAQSPGSKSSACLTHPPLNILRGQTSPSFYYFTRLLLFFLYDISA